LLILFFITSNLSDVNSSSLGTVTEIVVIAVSLSRLRVNIRKTADFVSSNVRIISSLYSSLVSRTDSLEDIVGLSDSSLLLALIVGVSSRVEKDESILLLSNSFEVSSSNCTLKKNNTVSVNSTCTVDGSSGNGSISRSNSGNSSKDGSSNGICPKAARRSMDKAVLVRSTEEGAKAATEVTRRAAVKSFMVGY